MKMLVLLLAGALVGCVDRSIELLSATSSVTPSMIAAADVLQQACPSLEDNGDRFEVMPAREQGASLTAQRDMEASQAVAFELLITQPEPGERYDVGEHCHFEAVTQPHAGVIASKEPCIRLCDASADTANGYLIRML